jgi:hypothetical protein
MTNLSPAPEGRHNVSRWERHRCGAPPPIFWRPEGPTLLGLVAIADSICSSTARCGYGVWRVPVAWDSEHLLR